MRLQLVSDDGTVTCVSAVGHITQDAFNCEEEPLAQLFGEGVYGGRLLLDLSQADYMDSRGVGWLLKCHRRFRQAGGMIVPHSVPPVVRDVLKVLHLNELLCLADDECAAREKALGVPHA